MARNKRIIPRGSPTEGSWEVTKKQVVATQLARAIRLFALENDPVSAHLLAGASRDILEILSKAADKPTIAVQMAERIKDEYRDEFFDILKDEYNFLKHASRDADVKMFFNPKSTEAFIWECCVNFQAIFGTFFEVALFSEWFCSNYPDVMMADYHEKLAPVRARTPGIYGADGKMTLAGMADMLRVHDENPHESYAIPSLSTIGAKPPV